MAGKGNKAGKGDTNGASAVPAAAGTAGLIFKKMATDFVIPPRATGGMWDDVVKQLQESKGSTVALFETADNDGSEAYTRSKSLRSAVKRAKADIDVAVRLIDGKHTLLAKAN